MSNAILREWSEEMGEISGFGGGYEAVCRAMVLAGIRWVDEHPNDDPLVKSFKGVFGVAVSENDPAKMLEAAMMNAPVVLGGKVIRARAGDDCTGAMHHAAMGHVLAYRRLGWDEYVRQWKEYVRQLKERKP